jgi:predicted permease
VLPNSVTAPNCNVIVRLKDGVSPEQAQAYADMVAQRATALHASDPSRGYGGRWAQQSGLKVFVRPMRLMFVDHGQDVRQTFFGLLGAVQFILLIVCANVANLALAKAEARQREFAVRAALGAGRWRLVRQSLTESIVLASVGGVAGLVLANWGIAILSLWVPEYMPQMRAVRIDQTALWISATVSLTSGILFGLAPAWRAGRTQKIYHVLKQNGSGLTDGTGGKWVRATLVVAEMSLTVVLMAGAGLMIQTVVGLLRTDPGFSTDKLLRVRIQLPAQKYSGRDKGPSKNAVLAEIQKRLSALPGVSGAGIWRDADSDQKIILDGQTHAEPPDVLAMGTGAGNGDALKIMGVRLLAGRFFEPTDMDSKAGEVVINRTMAETFWPGQNVIGKRFKVEDEPDGPFQIVGVIGDALSYDLRQPIQPTYVRPYQQFTTGITRSYFVRTSTDPVTLIGAIRKALLDAEPAMRPPTIGLYGDLLYQSTAAQRTYMLYLMSFAATGLLLSAIGIYGVLAYSVASRTREIGIRMAMGAQRHQLMQMILKDGIRLAMIGSTLGVLAAFWLTRFLQSQLHGVSPTDPTVFAAVVVTLLGVAAIACYLPARRAARVDPMVALRSE